MGSSVLKGAFVTAALFAGQAAQAWYGPICYSDRTTQLSLTIPSISGETAGDLKVDFDDNDGKVRLGVVRASSAVKGAHEVVLVRDAGSQNGIFAVVVTSPRSTTGYKFELEFRKDASECRGAIIKATDRAGGGLLAHSAPAAQPASSVMTLAANHVKARAPKPKKAKAVTEAPVSTETPVSEDAASSAQSSASPEGAVAQAQPSGSSTESAVNEIAKAPEAKPQVDVKPEAESKPKEMSSQETESVASPDVQAKESSSAPQQEQAAGISGNAPGESEPAKAVADSPLSTTGASE